MRRPSQTIESLKAAASKKRLQANEIRATCVGADLGLARIYDQLARDFADAMRELGRAQAEHTKTEEHATMVRELDAKTVTTETLEAARARQTQARATLREARRALDAAHQEYLAATNDVQRQVQAVTFMSEGPSDVQVQDARERVSKYATKVADLSSRLRAARAALDAAEAIDRAEKLDEQAREIEERIALVETGAC